MTNEVRDHDERPDSGEPPSHEDAGREASRDEAMMAGRAVPEAAPGEEGFPEGVPETKPQPPDEEEEEPDTKESEFPL